MSQSEDTSLEVLRIRRLLKRMYSLSEHSSLTGALSEGAVDAVEQYNLILTRLEGLGVIAGALFKQLPQDASFDRLGVASKLLEGYLVEEAEPERRGSGGSGDSNNVFIGNVASLEDLKDLGRIIRENLPDFLHKRVETLVGPPAPPTPPEPPEPLARTAAAVEEPMPMPDLSR